MSSTASKISGDNKTSSGSNGSIRTYDNYIDGKWQNKAEGGRTIPSLNPANNNEIIGHFAASTEADVDKAG